MAAESCRKRLRDEGTCSVCLEYFTAPVTLDCGHNFCRACIAKCWGESASEAPCPQCRENVQTKRLRPNKQLANMVEAVKELSELPKQESAVCERHQEPLKLFCQDDQALICVVCDRSKEHRAHGVVPVEEAAQEYMNQINSSLEILRKERGTILLHKVENEKETQSLFEQLEAEKGKTSSAFRQLHQFLEEQEKLLLAQVEEVEKEIARRRVEHQATLSAEVSSLDSLIQEMGEKQQQSMSELLQNIGNILARCKRKLFVNPVAFPVALKWKIHDFCDINPFLNAIMKQFKDTLLNELQLKKASVTLDPATAHPKLILSADRKSVRKGDKRQALPKNPERFDSWSIVLGREEFVGGRHFWEVDVGSEGGWAVGIASRSVRRKGKFEFSSVKGIWAIGKWGGQYRFNNGVDYAALPLSQEPKRIRVTLNCAGAQVAFFNADSGAHLHTYTSAPRRNVLPFFYVTGKARLKLAQSQSNECSGEALRFTAYVQSLVNKMFSVNPCR